MSKINSVTITVRDKLGGGVEIVADPSFEMMMKMHDHGDGSSAHGYAIAMLNRAREVSKQSGNIIIPIPKLGRRSRP